MAQKNNDEILRMWSLMLRNRFCVPKQRNIWWFKCGLRLWTVWVPSLKYPENFWWKAMVQMHETLWVLMPPFLCIRKCGKRVVTWWLNDPMIDNKDSKKRYRADQLLEDKIANTKKTAKRTKLRKLQADMDDALKAEDLPRLKFWFEEHEIACPVSGTRNWTDVRHLTWCLVHSLAPWPKAVSVVICVRKRPRYFCKLF